ncbi:hypothetical protein [Streptomyces alboflavus]|uniref:hypothetical protein n=1 Tax=Streptomyces alboflavus TaxID=67267 RepID=UPI0036ABA4EC
MRRSVVLVAGALAAMTALATPAAAVTAAPAAAVANAAPASPLPPLPAPESLITEGISIEGPLINNLGLPHLV